MVESSKKSNLLDYSELAEEEKQMLQGGIDSSFDVETKRQSMRPSTASGSSKNQFNQRNTDEPRITRSRSKQSAGTGASSEPRGISAASRRMREQQLVNNESNILLDQSSFVGARKLPFKCYQVFTFVNPRSGDGLAKAFLTDFPAKNELNVYFSPQEHNVQNQSVDCHMNFYNVIEGQEREKAMNDIKKSVKDQDSQNSTRRIVCIMGGDGSLATTVKMLRGSETINQALIRGKLVFCMLPFGTGNDGAQVFGWGASPTSQWMYDLECLARDMILSSTEQLTLWNCEVIGQVCSAKGDVLDNKILMCYYFNMGLDAEIGFEVEQNRTKKRLCNYMLYAYVGLKRFICCKGGMDIRDQVHSISSIKTLPNGLQRKKSAIEMKNVSKAPFNVVGLNLNSGMGNILNEKTWERSAQKQMDPGKELRQRNVAIFQTSCDESDSKLTQKIDDDKIELMCHENILDYADATLGRYGQVRSPFQVDYKEDYTSNGKQLMFGIDGEFYELKNCKQIKFQVDKMIPKLKILKRQGYVPFGVVEKEMLTDLKKEFNPSLF